MTELAKHATRVCPITCKTGESLKGDICIADKPAPAPAAVATPAPAPAKSEQPAAPATKSEQPAATAAKSDQKDEDKSRKKQAKAQPDRDQPKRQKTAAPASAPEVPHVRQQALARPSIISGGGGGGGIGGGGGSHTMIGVGF